MADEIDLDALSGTVNQLYGRKTAQPTAQPPIQQAAPVQQAAQPTTQTIAPLVAKKQLVTAAAPMAAPVATPSSDQIDTSQISSAVKDVYDNPPPEKVGVVKGILQDVLNRAKTSAQTLAGGVDVLYSVVPTVAGSVAQLGARPFTTPEKAEQIGQMIGQGVAGQPLGKYFGITGQPAYEHPLGSTGIAISQQINHMFNVLGMTPEQISEKTGISPADIRGVVNLGAAAAPALAETRAAQAVIKPVTQAVKTVVTPIANEAALLGDVVKKGAQAVTPMPVQRTIGKVIEAIAPGTISAPAVAKGLSATEAQAQFESRGGHIKQNVDQLSQNYEQQKASATEPTSVVQPVFDEFGQTIKTDDLGTAKPTTPDAPFKPVNYAEYGVPVDEQFARAKVLQKVLGSDHVVDMAALEGKGKERATNYQASKSDTDIGNYYTNRFADEQNRLQSYADQQAKNTGGVVGLDESANYKRGNNILEPLQALEKDFDTKTSALYKARDEQAQNVPVQANNIMSVLKDKSLNQSNTETIGLANGAEARLEQLGIIDKNGNLLPTNAKTAENFRQYLNEQFDPKNSKFQRALKDAVDTDVFANAGQNIYQDARALYERRKNTLDNPKGIASILEENGPNNINRKVDKEKVGLNISNMSVDQFSHVIDTFKNFPPELQAQAQQGLSNIKAQFASKVADLTSKPDQLTKFLNENREVMPKLFSADEMSNFRDLHSVSHILKTDTGYPGAYVQKLNVEPKLGTQITQQLLSKGAAGLAATGANIATAGTTAGLAETAAGLGANALVEQKFAKSQAKQLEAAKAQALKNAQSRFVPLSDLLGNK